MLGRYEMKSLFFLFLSYSSLNSILGWCEKDMGVVRIFIFYFLFFINVLLILFL